MDNIKFRYNINIFDNILNEKLLNAITEYNYNISLDIAFVLMGTTEIINFITAVKKHGGTIKTYNYMSLTDIEGCELYESLLNMGIDVFICSAPDRLVEHNREVQRLAY